MLALHSSPAPCNDLTENATITCTTVSKLPSSKHCNFPLDKWPAGRHYARPPQRGIPHLPHAQSPRNALGHQAFQILSAPSSAQVATRFLCGCCAKPMGPLSATCAETSHIFRLPTHNSCCSSSWPTPPYHGAVTPDLCSLSFLPQRDLGIDNLQEPPQGMKGAATCKRCSRFPVATPKQ